MIVKLKTPGLPSAHLLGYLTWRKFYHAEKETHGAISVIDDTGKKIFISKTQQRMHLSVS